MTPIPTFLKDSNHASEGYYIPCSDIHHAKIPHHFSHCVVDAVLLRKLRNSLPRIIHWIFINLDWFAIPEAIPFDFSPRLVHVRHNYPCKTLAVPLFPLPRQIQSNIKTRRGSLKPSILRLQNFRSHQLE